ncbi:MAG: adenylosuccinate synthase, partial [Halobacteriales archaeon]
MTVTIVGSQLGDEGKGGIVDVFGERADVVVRYQGGDNAGHTVVHGGEEYKLSLVPSGAIRGTVGVLGNGCVINPRTLFDEIDTLRKRGIDPDVRIARRAHVILPYHRVLDGIEEDAKSDTDLEAATTGRGIGPTYEDKAGRRGVRVGDLLDPEVLRTRLEYVVPRKRALAEDVFGVETGEAFDLEALYTEYRDIGERLDSEGMTVNAGAFLADRLADGANVMFEGAQGTGIDIDHGVYPYVTSSNPTAGGACTGTGLGPGVVGGGAVIGVVKAYLSRVGTGPLPTELGGVAGQTPGYGEDAGGKNGDLASYIREEGGEYGTVTGRPRRVGWLDMPMLRHAVRASDFTGIAINHLDTIAGLDEVDVAHSYTLDGEEVFAVPATTERWGDCEPNYRTFDGWPDADWRSIAAEGYGALPENARTYVEYVEN